MTEWRIAIVAAGLCCACGGSAVSSEPGLEAEPEPQAQPGPRPQPEPDPEPTTRTQALSCDEVPRWTSGASGYGARRGYLGFSPDGSRLAWSSGYYDAALVELDVESGVELLRVQPAYGEFPSGELVDRDSSWQRDLLGTYLLYVAASGSADSAVALDASYGSYAASGCARFDHAGRRVFRPSCDATGPSWKVFRAEDGALETTFAVPGDCIDMTSAQEKDDLLLSLGEHVVYWPAGSAAPTAQATHPHEGDALGQRGLVGLALDPVGRRAVSVAADGSVQLYRLPDLSPQPSAVAAHVTVANEDVYAPRFMASPVSFSHDGSVLVLAGLDGALEVRRSDTLEVQSRIAIAEPIAVAFAAGDGLLAVANTSALAVYACR